ncbi:unnamed protein product [marine sediment metagenome]|uniref:Uncharacterized protein n=1 Tax=marine sediment metagenome TaxID=412755 RepID=X1B0Y0_9ZZZZ
MQVRVWKVAGGKFDVLVSPSRRSGVATHLTRGATLPELRDVVAQAGILEQNAHAEIRAIKRASKLP